MSRRSAELYPGQRNKEKRELFKRYRLRAIEDLYKSRLFALFDNRCFKCGVEERPAQLVGRPPVLCIDHHVPMALAGHLVPGNLVALCRRCNESKLDQPPEQFYSRTELGRLGPLLAQQEGLLAFAFDWEAWNADRGKYLLRLGMEPSLVHDLLDNPDHPEFIGSTHERLGGAVSIDADGSSQIRRVTGSSKS